MRIKNRFCQKVTVFRPQDLDEKQIFEQETSYIMQDIRGMFRK